MATRTAKAEDFGQDAELGELVETRVADPDGRWRRVHEVHEALLAAGVTVLTVQWGDPDGTGAEVRVLADQAVVEPLTALPVPRDARADLAGRIDGVATLAQLKTLLRDELLPKLRLAE